MAYREAGQESDIDPLVEREGASSFEFVRFKQGQVAARGSSSMLRGPTPARSLSARDPADQVGDPDPLVLGQENEVRFDVQRAAPEVARRAPGSAPLGGGL